MTTNCHSSPVCAPPGKEPAHPAGQELSAALTRAIVLLTDDKFLEPPSLHRATMDLITAIGKFGNECWRARSMLAGAGEGESPGVRGRSR